MTQNTDPRLLSLGSPIPGLHYCDQPYIVIADDGTWVCSMTTSAGHEGEPDQHVSISRSTDGGRTWGAPARLESPDQPENSYSVLLKTSFGRIYCFYNFNADNVREAKTDDGRVFKRVDTLGQYVMRYSDDHGRSWSAKRYTVPVREFECDRSNPYGGAIRYFWNVGRPLVSSNQRDVFLGLHKVGSIGNGFQTHSEGVFIHSDNILDERDPERLRFETLPDGDVGVRLPGNARGVAEEHSLVELSDGSLFCVFRTKEGFPGCAYSRDRGHTWSESQFMTYSRGGRRVKHPRAANFVWRCSNGKFLYWFHNHGGQAIKHHPLHSHNGWAYNGRNPAWLMCGVERPTPEGLVIEWSQPEIALYDDSPQTGISYPDLVEVDGRYFISQTQKTQGRVNEIDPRIIEALFNQFDSNTVSNQGLILHWTADNRPSADAAPATAPLGSQLPFFIARDSQTMASRPLRTGVSIDFWLTLDSLAAGQAILHNLNEYGYGWSISTTAQGTLELVMSDGFQKCVWDCDRDQLHPGRRQHVVVIVDGGPNIIRFVIDGRLCDGGDGPQDREYGWSRFSPTLQSMAGGPTVEIHPCVHQLRVYDRALLTSEAVAASRQPQGELIA